MSTCDAYATGTPSDSVTAAQTLLKLRAIRYAHKEPTSVSDSRDAIVFARNQGRYAVLVTDLREIRPLRRLCRIPSASRIVPGVFYYRGEILSAHDLGCLLTECEPETLPPWVLVLDYQRERIGLLADAILHITTISADSISAPPVTLGVHRQGFDGVLNDGALLLSPARLLAMPEFMNAF